MFESQSLTNPQAPAITTAPGEIDAPIGVASPSTSYGTNSTPSSYSSGDRAEAFEKEERLSDTPLLEDGAGLPAHIAQDDATTASDLSDDEENEEKKKGCCGRFWAKWKFAFIIIGLNFLMSTSGVVLSPLLPGIKRRYFGGDKEAALVQTSMNAASAAINLLLCPISGYLMDVIGRKPFFRASMIANSVPPILLLVFYPNPLPFMISQMVASLIIGSYATTYIADHYRGDKGRLLAFAAVAAAGSAPTALGFVVVALSDYECIILSLVFQALALLYVFIFIKESLAGDKVQKFDIKKVENPFKAMKSVMNTKISMVTIAVMGMFTVSQSGVGEVYFYYLNEKVGFNKADNAAVFLEAGIMWPLTMLVVIPFFKRCLKMHSISMVLVSVVALAGEMTLMCLVDAKWQIFVFGLPAAALVNMSNPALTAVIADGSNGEDQGRRQAGLAAIGDFFGTLAPLFFGQMYSHLPAEYSFLPFAIAGVLCIPTFVLAFKLRRWIVVLGHRNLSRNNSAAPTPRAAYLDDIKEPIESGDAFAVDVCPHAE